MTVSAFDGSPGPSTEAGQGASPRALIIVQNLAVQRDRRVWGEATALRDAGFAVTVVCPGVDGAPLQQRVDGIEIRGFRVPQREGAAGYVLESVWAFAAATRHAVAEWRRHGFDVLQACNPPDTYVVLAQPFRWLGVPYVFDHHDLAPEVYAAKFGREDDLFQRLLRLFERATFRFSDHVLSTNESYRDIAIRRGHVSPAHLTVVRNGPDAGKMRRGPEHPELRRGRRHLLCYLGMMGPQDGVEHVLQATDELVHGMGRDDVHVALLGDGEALPDLRELSRRVGVEDHVTFTGFVDDTVIGAYLSTAVLGLSPEPKNAFNDHSTLIKVGEYLAYELPVVAFDLTETRRTAGEAAAYVTPSGDPAAYAKTIAGLLDAPDRRARMGRVGRARVDEALAWEEQRDRYVEVMTMLAGRSRAARRRGRTRSRLG